MLRAVPSDDATERPTLGRLADIADAHLDRARLALATGELYTALGEIERARRSTVQVIAAASMGEVPA